MGFCVEYKNHVGYVLDIASVLAAMKLKCKCDRIMTDAYCGDCNWELAYQLSCSSILGSYAGSVMGIREYDEHSGSDKDNLIILQYTYDGSEHWGRNSCVTVTSHLDISSLSRDETLEKLLDDLKIGWTWSVVTELTTG